MNKTKPALSHLKNKTRKTVIWTNITPITYGRMDKKYELNVIEDKKQIVQYCT